MYRCLNLRTLTLTAVVLATPWLGGCIILPRPYIPLVVVEVSPGLGGPVQAATHNNSH